LYAQQEVPVAPVESETVEDPVETAPEDPSAEVEGVTEDVSVSDVTMNGAQVSSLLTVIENVVNGSLPRDSAMQIIMTAFNVPEQKADSILGSVGRGFTPATVVEEEVDV
jgi:hypothetical protein